MAACISGWWVARPRRTAGGSNLGCSKRRSRLSGLAIIGLMFVNTSTLNAGLVIAFTNGGSLDGHVAGNTAAFVIDGQNATLTTRSVAPSGTVNTTSGALGINAVGTDTANAFNDGESWAFDWSIDTLFDGVDFQAFSTATEKFSLQANDWIGLSFTPQASSNIAFNSAEGRFTFTAGDATDNFNLTDLSTGTPLPVSAGTDLTLSFSDSGPGNASLQSITFASNTASVPEPGTLVLTALGALAILIVGRSNGPGLLKVSGTIVSVGHAPRARIEDAQHPGPV